MSTPKSMVLGLLRNIKKSELNFKSSDGLREPVALRNPVISFKSYNPSLTKEDFLMQLPRYQLSQDFGKGEVGNFRLWKVRDDRYFMFRDKYLLHFDTVKGMKAYMRMTGMSRLDDRKLRFETELTENQLEDYTKYRCRLKKAFSSREEYFQSLKEPLVWSENEILSADDIREIELKSLLVWNFPMDYKRHNVLDKFWWYDIKDCFKIYWNTNTGRNLTYMSFNNPDDAVKFKLNLHGSQLEEQKLLIEKL
ncbi:Pet54p Ecym_2073 [Eremothecium cymbalariae DBVPG|uniref:RNA recognition motif domain-containing protein n=1 Tax=Eremothecium cymbalariae (strain CBS 270.75 / DBVPG 7215 / KCTC 17166 / NRRL Y-17582) TaxID=931890 RepID=G8JPI0_ERECY|nr:Hypothetical protein Ecym_2073 [Eremothecium cymbalariae DBVPG\